RFCANFSSSHDADDVTQEVFLRATRRLDLYRGESSVLSWLLSIARHVCADQVRRNQRQRRLAERLRGERHLAARSETGISDLTALLDALDADRRAAFVLT